MSDDASAVSPAGPLWGRCEELRPAELTHIMQRYPLAFVPSGTLEWHAPHLPIGLDGLLAEEVCLRAARQAGGIVVPPTYWAIGGVPHPFTTRIDPEVVERLFVSILEQLAHVGFRAVFILAGHYGIDHYAALKRAAVRVMQRGSMTICAMPEFELVTDQGFQGGDHAGAWETSLLWAIRPDLVVMDRLPATGAIEGVIGEDPRHGAGAERGQALLAILVERMAQVATRLIADTSASARSAHLDALVAQVEILEQVRQDRATKPRPRVRGLMSAAYLRYLDHFWRGEYSQARLAAEDARLALDQSLSAGP